MNTNSIKYESKEKWKEKDAWTGQFRTLKARLRPAKSENCLNYRNFRQDKSCAPPLAIEKLCGQFQRVGFERQKEKRRSSKRWEKIWALKWWKEYCLFSSFLKTGLASNLTEVTVFFWPQIAFGSPRGIQRYRYGMRACLYGLGKWSNFRHFTSFPFNENKFSPEGEHDRANSSIVLSALAEIFC